MGSIKKFDLFGFTPSFRIDGKDELKSFIGGISTIFFMIISLSYFIYSIINYLETMENIATSRQIYTKSKNYTLNSKDISFGIGLLDQNDKILSLKNHPYLELYSEYIGWDLNYENSIESKINLTSCTRNLFIPNIDFLQYKPKLQKLIDYTLQNYNCFDYSNGLYFEPETFSQSSFTLKLYVRLKPGIDLQMASKWMDNNKPSINLIYQDYLIEGNNKLKPFSRKINIFSQNIEFSFFGSTDIYINPYNILDDTNPFASGTFSYINDSDYSSQKDGTIFIIQRNADYFNYFPNRDIKNYTNTNLIEFDLTLASLGVNTLRTYRKFNDFVASVSSIISNIFLVFAIIASKLNKIKGINNMVKSLFSLDKIQIIQNFKGRFEKISDKFFIYEKQMNKKIPLKTKLSPSRKSLKEKKTEFIIEVEKTLTDQNCLRRSQTTFEKKLDDLFEEKIQLNLKEYLRYKYFCKKKRLDILLDNAFENVQDMLDINTYMKFKLQIDMLKEIILDKNQKSAFDIISTILNFNKLFEPQKSGSNCLNLKDFVEGDIEDVLNPLIEIITRKNETDEKIINFFKKILTFK